MVSVSLSHNPTELIKDLPPMLFLYWGKRFCATSIPTFGRLSFPRMFRSWASVIKKIVVSYVLPMDLIGTMTCPTIFIGSHVKPRCRSFVAWSTVLVFKSESRNLSSWSMFHFKTLSGLAESTCIFSSTKFSFLIPILSSFFNSFQSILRLFSFPLVSANFSKLIN